MSSTRLRIPLRTISPAIVVEGIGVMPVLYQQESFVGTLFELELSAEETHRQLQPLHPVRQEHVVDGIDRTVEGDLVVEQALLTEGISQATRDGGCADLMAFEESR